MNLMEELDLLSDEEKKDVATQTLEGLGFTVRSVNRAGEMKIPCVISAYHSDQDKHPTGSLNYRKLLFNCLGCQASGTILWLIAETLGLPGSQEGGEWLKSKVGIKQVMDNDDLLRIIEGMYEREDTIPAIPRYSPRTLLEWLKPDHTYFQERGISLAQALRFQLGYESDTNRVVIPHYYLGDLVGWQTRALGSRSHNKYLNSTDFPRESTLFNYDHRRDAVVVESTFSVMKHDSDDLHMEATFGSKVTDIQIGLLAKHSRVYLWMDNDNAGWLATGSMIARLTPLTKVYVIESPWKGDPADLPSAEVKRLVSSAVPAALWTRPERLDQYVR